jgi:LuxR family transcriptional regulator, transcriptional regulator of spore coat protein
LSNQKGKPLLTNREREVFELLVQDRTTKEIAQQLFISEKTVRNHISNVMRCIFKKGDNPRATIKYVLPYSLFDVSPEHDKEGHCGIGVNETNRWGGFVALFYCVQERV